MCASPDVGDGGHQLPREPMYHPALVVATLWSSQYAEHLHGDKAVGTDAANHAAEFVHVGIEHDSRARVSLASGDDGAQDRSYTYLVGERAACDRSVMTFAHRFFYSYPGRAGNFGEFFQIAAQRGPHLAVEGGWPLSVDLAGQSRKAAGRKTFAS